MPYEGTPLDRKAILGTRDLAERFAEIQRQQRKTIGRKQRAMTTNALFDADYARGHHSADFEGTGA